MQKIKQLPLALANQIAAGEVIERPASVIKELLENSLDAGATDITVEIKGAGVELIRITDNGEGIAKDELILAVSRHATSKIYELNDLMSVMTLGFRGEALASIASISRFSLTSKTKQDAHASRVDVDARSEQCTLSPAALPGGTSVVVENLFYNVPARRKFLRSEATELAQCEAIFKRIALSHYHCSFKLIVENKGPLFLPKALTEAEQHARTLKILGSSAMQNAKRIDTGKHGIRLQGWLGSAESHRSQNDLQFFYLNNRMIRDKVIQHAIRMTYGDAIPPGRFPVYCLYLTVDPAAVDVNVHPTKHEVRFREARFVHDFIVSALAELTEQVPQVPWSAERGESFRNAAQSYHRVGTPKYETEQFVRGSVANTNGLNLITTLATQFWLLSYQDRYYLLDFSALQRALLRATLTTQLVAEEISLDIAKPLLTPHQTTLNALQYKQFQKVSMLFLKQGFRFECNEALAQITFTHTPKELPTLNLPLFLQAVVNDATLTATATDNWLTVLIQHALLLNTASLTVMQKMSWLKTIEMEFFNDKQASLLSDSNFIKEFDPAQFFNCNEVVGA